MKWLYQIQQKMPYGVKTTEAPHYRRVYLQESKRLGTGQLNRSPKRADFLGRAPQPVNDGDGFVFISHTGAVYPSGFLPLACGNIREQPLLEIYQNSPVMKDLRDKSKLKGKCGVCEFKNICGGSRARAYAVTGDYLESDPYCAYIPKALR